MKSKIFFWGVIIFSLIILTGCGGKYKFNDPTILETREGDPMFCSESCPITPTSKLILRNVRVTQSPKSQEYSDTADPALYKELEKHIREKWENALGKCPFFENNMKNKAQETSSDENTYFVDIEIEAVLFATQKKVLQTVARGFFIMAQAFQDHEQVDYIISVYDLENNLLAQGIQQDVTVVDTGYFSANTLKTEVIPWQPALTLCEILGRCYFAMHPDELEMFLKKIKEEELEKDEL